MILTPRKRFQLETTLFFVASLAIAALAVYGEWFRGADRWIYDALIRADAAPRMDDLVIVGIDDQSLEAFGPWPWSRARQAELLTAINQTQPRAILLDVVFANRSEASADSALVRAAAAVETLALPVIIDAVANRQQLIEVMPYPGLLEQADVLGHAHIELDEDAIARGTHLFQGIGSAHWPHITLVLADHLGLVSAGDFVCADAEPAEFSIENQRCGYVYTPYVGPPGSFEEVSALDLMTSPDPLTALADKLVFVGVVASGTTDMVATPVSGESRAMSGIEYNANLFNALAQELTVVRAGLGWVLALSLGCVSLPVLTLPRLRAKGMLGSALLCALVPFAITAVALLSANIWIPLASAVIVCLFAYPYWSWRRHEVAWQFVAAEIERLDRERLRWDTVRAANESQRLDQLAAFLDAEITQPPSSWVIDARDIIEIRPGESQSPRLTRMRPFSEVERGLARAALARLAEDPSHHEGLPGERLIAEIRRLQELAEEVRVGREIGQRSLEQMPTGVVVFSALGDVLLINSAARTFLGFPDESPAEYLQLLRHIAPPLGQNWHEVARAVVIDRRPVSFETRAVGGEQVVVEASALAEEHALAETWVLSITDMTEIRVAERDREEALAFLSHDLRSPMLSVLALVRGSDKRSPLNAIGDYAQRALQVSEQFLQLSRVQAREAFERYEINVLSVLSNAIEQMYTLAAEKRIEVVVDPFVEKDEHGVWVLGNGELLERAFVNLLANAVKYSKPGSQVRVEVLNADNEITIVFVDRGTGIPHDEVAQVFEPFFRSAAKELAQERGAGLGLRFVKTVIERHGGSVSVQSSFGEGSRFAVTLPKLDDSEQE